MSRLSKSAQIELNDRMRNLIRNAFAELTIAHGEISMNALAAHLNVAKGTLYNYYSTKEELLRDVMQERANIMFSRMEQEIPVSGSAREQLLVYARIMMEDFEHYRYLRAEFLRHNPLPPHRPTRNLLLVEKILNRGIQRGEFRRMHPGKLRWPSSAV